LDKAKELPLVRERRSVIDSISWDIFSKWENKNTRQALKGSFEWKSRLPLIIELGVQEQSVYDWLRDVPDEWPEYSLCVCDKYSSHDISDWDNIVLKGEDYYLYKMDENDKRRVVKHFRDNPDFFKPTRKVIRNWFGW